mmetsp:Transcript_39409/g.128916  ORF Transcript_39409/g.128916 Transcript_39409/m.128916 type:complete len:397 (+) Transcript_39409:116-1306(+)
MSQVPLPLRQCAENRMLSCVYVSLPGDWARSFPVFYGSLLFPHLRASRRERRQRVHRHRRASREGHRNKVCVKCPKPAPRQEEPAAVHANQLERHHEQVRQAARGEALAQRRKSGCRGAAALGGVLEHVADAGREPGPRRVGAAHSLAEDGGHGRHREGRHDRQHGEPREERRAQRKLRPSVAARGGLRVVGGALGGERGERAREAAHEPGHVMSTAGRFNRAHPHARAQQRRQPVRRARRRLERCGVHVVAVCKGGHADGSGTQPGGAGEKRQVEAAVRGGGEPIPARGCRRAQRRGNRPDQRERQGVGLCDGEQLVAQAAYGIDCRIRMRRQRDARAGGPGCARGQPAERVRLGDRRQRRLGRREQCSRSRQRRCCPQHLEGAAWRNQHGEQQE